MKINYSTEGTFYYKNKIKLNDKKWKDYYCSIIYIIDIILIIIIYNWYIKIRFNINNDVKIDIKVMII